MKVDVYIVAQGRTLLMPDWPPAPTMPDWLRAMILKNMSQKLAESELGWAHSATVARLRELGCV